MSQTDHSGSSFAKILLGLDGSSYSQAATEYACQIAQTEAIVTMDYPLPAYRDMLNQHHHELLVMESRDEKQVAMRGLTYAMAVEFSDIAMLLI